MDVLSGSECSVIEIFRVCRYVMRALFLVEVESHNYAGATRGGVVNATAITPRTAGNPMGTFTIDGRTVLVKELCTCFL